MIELNPFKGVMVLIQKNFFRKIITALVILFIASIVSCGVAKTAAIENTTSTPNYMSFTLTNRSGTLVSTSTPLSRASTYGLVIKREEGASLTTADYDIIASPANAITINTRLPNIINFTVNNISDMTVTITATHRLDSSITETLTVKLASQANFMSFTLSNNGGPLVSTSNPLARGNTYVLTIKRENDAPLLTADYEVVSSPPGAITINTTRSSSNLIDFTVNNTDATSITISTTHKNNPVISNTLVLSLEPPVVINTTFQQDIENANTVPNLAIVNVITREVLAPLGVPAATPLEKRYVTENGAGTKDGSTWLNAWAATDLRNNINTISDATANKVYLIMIAGGTYKPAYGSIATRSDSFSMKNYVAIMGGFQPSGGWGRTGTTFMSGDIGTAGSSADNSYHVFHHNGINLANSHLYGVTITNGNANTSLEREGGGMHNNRSSPNLTRVIFSGNHADLQGGGMYNNISSPVLNNTVFSGNTTKDGGGMHNTQFSSPVLNNTVFSGNSASGKGGGMNNSVSSLPVILGAVFSGNSAKYGGGIYNNDTGTGRLIILNTIFSGNTTNDGTGAGSDIAIDFSGSSTENITIAGSVLGIGLVNPTNAIVGFNGSGTMSINYHHLSKDAVNLGTPVTSGGVTYPPITTGSSAINRGLYVRRSGNGTTATYYYSEDNTTWYNGFSATGGFSGSPVTPPSDAEDLTTTDITGNARSGRPDAGVYEL